MTTTRLTDNPLLFVGLWYRFKLPHEIFLGLFSFHDTGLCRGSRAGVVADAGGHNIFAINHPSAGTIRVADRDAIVERHKESIGVSVKKAYAIGHMGMTAIRVRR
jgi:hypothetical protein